MNNENDLINSSQNSLNDNLRKISNFIFKIDTSNYKTNSDDNNSCGDNNSGNGGEVAVIRTRDTWTNDIEFLFSCIALSVGLGNVWRFPFTALDNGGGAFVVPYIIVLILVGKPVYYMEMIIGQFSSRGSIKVFDFSPALRGIGYGQVMGTGIVCTYYASLMALTVRYIFYSMNETLPWSECNPNWTESCVDSKISAKTHSQNRTSSSAELFFLKEVLREKDSIHNGIGQPNWELVGCLAFSWAIVALVLIRGVKSSGKASYFLAIFPYIVMVVLLVRAVTLPGSMNGILYFIKPQWDQLLNPKVWYAAITQVFFSLAICFGNIIMYSSYNRFSHNIYRDVTIVTTLDTCTSLLAGCIVFGILGNLAYETNTTDIQNVVKGGTGLAFITYPDAISKFQYVPQVFSVLFFTMLFVLGIGSNVGMTNVIITVLRDQFPHINPGLTAAVISIIGFCVGCIYVTPGGQFLLNLLDFYAVTFVALVLAAAQLIGFGWIYGVNRFCKDVEFMLGLKTGLYWRICWGIVTPFLMIAILVYTIIDMKPLQYRDYIYPDIAYGFGWCLFAFGVLQLPIWAAYAIWKSPERGFRKRIINSFRPMENWGPVDLSLNEKYQEFRFEQAQLEAPFKRSIYDKIKINLFDL